MHPEKPARVHLPFLLLACLVLLSACASWTGETAASGVPENIGDLKPLLYAYKKSGSYDRDVAAVAADAQAYVEARAGHVGQPALVLDIDETSLSNWPALAANDFAHFPDARCDSLPHGPCGMKAWQNMARSKAIAPTLALFKSAKAHNVAVFFITGRDESLRDATVRNLRKGGYDGWNALIMRPRGSTTPSAADYKAPARAKIEAEGYTILAAVGDQPSDLSGGHAERTFLVPNPFYRIP